MASIARTASRSLVLAISLLLPGCGLVGLIVPSPILSAIDPPDPLPTIPGPEDEHLLDDVHGTLLWLHEGSWPGYGSAAVEVVTLPELSRRTVRVGGHSYASSGPDDRGRFVYFTFTGLRLHDLSTNQDTRLVAWEEGEGTVAEAVLAPRNGRLLIAFRREIRQGETRTTVHDVQLWNIDSGERRGLGPLPILSAEWFPDGRHVAVVVEATAATEAWGLEPAHAGGDSSSPAASSQEPRKSIQVLDVDTGRFRWVAWGHAPNVSTDGRSLIYTSEEGTKLVLHALESGAERDVVLPGLLLMGHEGGSADPRLRGRCLGWLSERIVLYEALATEGEDPGYVPAQNMMMGHYPKWTVKAADVETGSFMTVMPSVNRPWASFGSWTPR